MEFMLGATLITFGLCLFGLGMIALAKRSPSCKCGVEWINLHSINVYNYDKGYVESVIFIRQCPNCKLIHKQKVSN